MTGPTMADRASYDWQAIRVADAAYRAGYRAANSLEPATVCPHAEGSALHAEWLRGYFDVYDG